MHLGIVSVNRLFFPAAYNPLVLPKVFNMNEKRIIIKSLDELPSGKTDWSKVKKMTEEEIELAAKSDPDVQLLTLKQLRQFKRVIPQAGRSDNDVSSQVKKSR